MIGEWGHIRIRSAVRRTPAFDGFGIGPRPHTLANAWRKARRFPLTERRESPPAFGFGALVWGGDPVCGSPSIPQLGQPTSFNRSCDYMTDQAVNVHGVMVN
jgi:hypothetical protein